MERYGVVLRELGIDERRYATYAARLFEGVPLEGRRVLDVGGGSGLISFYAAAMGARVTCLEPGAAGSNAEMPATFQRLEEALGSAVEVQLDPRSLQAFDAPPASLDVVVVHNTINHLDERACAALPRDPEARASYVRLFEAVARWTRPGGTLLVSDCARLNLFDVLRLRNPFVPDIDWRLHQQPGVWARLATEAGFADPQVRWNPMTRAGRVGAVLLGNWLGAFATQSHFTLRVRRAAAASGPGGRHRP
jgi:SAM-dependent methyltransferase